jgi:hypothetical protein
MFETNPLKNPGDIFGRKKTAGQKTLDLLKQLGVQYEIPEPEDSMSVLSALGEDPLASSLSLRPGKAMGDLSMDIYNPQNIYGNFYKKMGGRKVRGLLGD